MTHSSHNPRNS